MILFPFELPHNLKLRMEFHSFDIRVFLRRIVSITSFPLPVSSENGIQ